jgi:hypothetical protein
VNVRVDKRRGDKGTRQIDGLVSRRRVVPSPNPHHLFAFDK